MNSRTLRVCLVVGYFDWFSGYQEVALAKALSRMAQVEIVASTTVSPIFTDAHLDRLQVPRRYPASLMRDEQGCLVTRFDATERRSMVWSLRAVQYLRRGKYDVVIQVMPGQGLPIAPSVVGAGERRVALYGDNSAMWSGMSPVAQRVKWHVFSRTKGVAYRYVNRRAHSILCYTPETHKRLKPFRGGTPSSVLPLCFDEETFFLDYEIRAKTRAELGFSDHDFVLMTAGKLSHYKRLETFLEASSALTDRVPSLKLVLVGADGGAYSQQLQASVRDHERLASRTSFLPFLGSAELNAVFNAADAGAWPHLPAITIQQAMGTGLPVVLPRNDWVGHLLRADSGEYFSPDQGVAGFVEALQRQIGNSRLPAHDRASIAAANQWLSSTAAARTVLQSAAMQ